MQTRETASWGSPDFLHQVALCRLINVNLTQHITGELKLNKLIHLSDFFKINDIITA